MGKGQGSGWLFPGFPGRIGTDRVGFLRVQRVEMGRVTASDAAGQIQTRRVYLQH
jgi:hypothetical protein